MSDNSFAGLANAERMLEQLPQAAREQLGVELAILGREGLQMQKAAAPEDTGALRAGLSLQLLLDELVVRIGLIGTKARSAGALRRAAKLGGSAYNLGALFYGRIVNFGRRAQTVVVERRRRVNGTLRSRRRRKQAEDVVATYTMKVKARAATNFIDAPGVDFEATAAGQLNEFWIRTLAKAEA